MIGIRVGARVFIATGNASNITGTDLTGGHANIEELTGGSSVAGVEVDGVAAFYTIGTRVLAVQVQQDNGVDFTGTATFPIASTARYGLLETATNAEATAGTEADKALTPSNLATIAGVLGSTEVDEVVMDYSDGTRTISVDVRQDNGVDIEGSQILPVASQVRFGLVRDGHRYRGCGGKLRMPWC